MELLNALHWTELRMPPSNKEIEAAICISGGLQDANRYYTDEVLEGSERHFPTGLGIRETFLVAAHYNGRRSIGTSDFQEMFAYAMPSCHHRLFAAFSTINLPTILSNVANKFLREGFNAVEQEWAKIAAIGTTTSFKPTTTASLTGDLEFEKVGPTGEIKHGTLGEETYGNQADTYAKMMTLTRRDIINDDLGALTGVAMKLGRGAALKLNKVFWGAFLNNSTFFTALRNNYDNAAGTAFSADSLIAADVLFKAQTDPDGNPLGSRAKNLVVPPGLEIPAKRLMSSQKLLETTNAGEDNPLAGMFRVVSSQYLADSTLTGYSPIAWYLLADPLDIPVIEVAFLNGRTMPVVESAEADFNTLGIQFRGYHDFGVALQEYRGGVKFAGTPAGT